MEDDRLSIWEVSDKGYPRHGEIKEQLKYLLRFAILAPSTHNTQPWLFKVSENKISIFADMTRSLPVIDPENKELIMSCGAALGNIMVSMNYFGFSYLVKPFPNPSNKEHVADISIRGKKLVQEIDRKLFRSITKRRTNRLPFIYKIIDGLILQKFSTLASEESVKLKIIYGKKDGLMKIIERADKIQSENQEFCKELSHWVHPERSDANDGIPGYAFGAGDIITTSGPFFIGNLNWGNIQAGRDRNLIQGSTVILIFATKNNEPTDWLKTGIAVSKVSLNATAEKLAISYLNQPLETSELISELKVKIGVKGHPQIIMRVGIGSEIKPSPRRSLEEVLLP